MPSLKTKKSITKTHPVCVENVPIYPVCDGGDIILPLPSLPNRVTPVNGGGVKKHKRSITPTKKASPSTKKSKTKKDSKQGETITGTKEEKDVSSSIEEEVITDEEFRIQCGSFLLTYNRAEIPFEIEDMHAISKMFWEYKIPPIHLSISLEEGKSRHIHVYVSRPTDCKLSFFKYEGITPNCRVNRARGKGKRASEMRGHYYAGIAPKIGQIASQSSLVDTKDNDKSKFDLLSSAWAVDLVRQRKMTPANCRNELYRWQNADLYQLKKLDNLENWLNNEAAKSRNRNIIEKAKNKFLPWRTIEMIEEWRKQYVDPSELRYKFLIITGASRTGKSEYARSLFKNPFEHKGKISWKGYNDLIHDGIIYHDVSNIFRMILEDREFFQSNGVHTVQTSVTNCYAKDVNVLAKPIVIVTNKDNFGEVNQNEWISANSDRYELAENEILWKQDV